MSGFGFGDAETIEGGYLHSGAFKTIYSLYKGGYSLSERINS